MDYLSTSLPDLAYTWVLMTIGWVLPNLLIMVSHTTVIRSYRSEYSKGRQIIGLQEGIPSKVKQDIIRLRSSPTLLFLSRKNYCELFTVMETRNSSSARKHKKQRMMVRSHSQYSILFLLAFQSERKLWRSSLLLLCCWTIAWTPYALVFLASLSGNRQLITQHTDMIPGMSHSILI